MCHLCVYLRHGYGQVEYRTLKNELCSIGSHRLHSRWRRSRWNLKMYSEGEKSDVWGLSLTLTRHHTGSAYIIVVLSRSYVRTKGSDNISCYLLLGFASRDRSDSKDEQLSLDFIHIVYLCIMVKQLNIPGYNITLLEYILITTISIATATFIHLYIIIEISIMWPITNSPQTMLLQPVEWGWRVIYQYRVSWSGTLAQIVTTDSPKYLLLMECLMPL